MARPWCLRSVWRRQRFRSYTGAWLDAGPPTHESCSTSAWRSPGAPGSGWHDHAPLVRSRALARVRLRGPTAAVSRRRRQRFPALRRRLHEPTASDLPLARAVALVLFSGRVRTGPFDFTPKWYCASSFRAVSIHCRRPSAFDSRLGPLQPGTCSCRPMPSVRVTIVLVLLTAGPAGWLRRSARAHVTSGSLQAPSRPAQTMPSPMSRRPGRADDGRCRRQRPHRCHGRRAARRQCLSRKSRGRGLRRQRLRQAGRFDTGRGARHHRVTHRAHQHAFCRDCGRSGGALDARSTG